MSPARMIRRAMNLGLTPILTSVLASACIESPQEPVDYPATVVRDGNGTAVSGAWTITLDRADVALGPFYFCAATSGSSTLCASSISEVQNITRVDALAAEAPLGRVNGFSGSIRSVSYDLGISWFDTQPAPTPADVAPGGHSMHLEGRAQKGDQVLALVADVDVVPQYQGQTAVPTAAATADVPSSASRLEVHLDAAAWLKQLDLDALAATGASTITIAPGSKEHGDILVGIKNLAPITFRWVSVP